MTMQLYHELGFVDVELAALGYSADAPLTAEVLAPFDSMHYGGTVAVDEALAALSLRRGDRVLDVGSGLGGPARHMASRAGCRVVALEMQPACSAQAEGYTRRCGLGELVRHVAGDVLEPASVPEEGFDALTSWLCFLHIPDKAALLTRCATLLRPSGALYVEDFFALAPFTSAEADSLARDVFARSLPTREEYLAALAASGFVDVEWVDMTSEWTRFVVERLRAWVQGEARTHAVHAGSHLYEARLAFYSAMARLFEGGHLGGVRVKARRA